MGGALHHQTQIYLWKKIFQYGGGGGYIIFWSSQSAIKIFQTQGVTSAHSNPTSDKKIISGTNSNLTLDKKKFSDPEREGYY